jgi:Fe-S-cluster containining protein
MKSTEFKCKRCGGCCGLAPFTKADYKAAWRKAKNLGVTLVKQQIEGKRFYIPRSIERRLARETQENIAKHPLVCPFVKIAPGGAVCMIYELRPEICRLFGEHSEQHDLLKCPNQEENNG